MLELTIEYDVELARYADIANHAAEEIARLIAWRSQMERQAMEVRASFPHLNRLWQETEIAKANDKIRVLKMRKIKVLELYTSRLARINGASGEIKTL